MGWPDTKCCNHSRSKSHRCTIPTMQFWIPGGTSCAGNDLSNLIRANPIGTGRDYSISLTLTCLLLYAAIFCVIYQQLSPRALCGSRSSTVNFYFGVLNADHLKPKDWFLNLLCCLGDTCSSWRCFVSFYILQTVKMCFSRCLLMLLF